MDDLVKYLPAGEAQYVRASDGTWAVRIFAKGTVEMLTEVATRMNKGVAAWFAHKLNSRV